MMRSFIILSQRNVTQAYFPFSISAFSGGEEVGAEGAGLASVQSSGLRLCVFA
jgi:hypothetical protein